MALPGRGSRRELLADPAGDGFAVIRCRFDGGSGGTERVEGGEEVAGFPDVRTGTVGADLAGITPGVDGEKMVGHRGSEVHRSAVHTDDKRRMAQEPKKLGEAGLVEEIDGAGREVRQRGIGASDQHDRAIHGAAKGGDGFRSEGFSPAAGKGMQNDKRSDG